MSFFEQPFRFGTSGKLYQNLSDPGSMLFGGAGVSNSLGQKRDGTKGGFFGDKAQGIDWAGSPITAGTNSQGTARLAAILYGLWAGAGALGGGSAAGSSGGGLGGLGGASEAGASEGGALGGTSSGGASTGGTSPLTYLNWARRGYGAYNMLNNMSGGQQQPQGGSPYGGMARPYQSRPVYGNGAYMQPQQRPLPGSGPFDWLKF